MTRDEIILRLEQWLITHDRLSKTWERLEAGLGLEMTGTPVFDASWGAFEIYTETLALLLGDTDAHWMSWHWLENDMGGKGHAAGYDGRMTPIETLGDLADLIVEGRGR